MALRQTTGFVESLLRLIGLDWAVPDFSTLSRRQKTLKVNIPYRGSDGPLHLLVDSTGIKVEGEGEWNARKHGGSKRRIWRKIHIGIDEKSLEIRAVEFTTSDVGDAPMLFAVQRKLRVFPEMQGGNKNSGRRAIIDMRPDKQEIIKDIVLGRRTLTEIAKRIGVDYTTIQRYRDEKISEEMRRAIMADQRIKEVEQNTEVINKGRRQRVTLTGRRNGRERVREVTRVFEALQHNSDA